MTKKDFQVIANMLGDMFSGMAWNDCVPMVATASDHLAKTNPRFNSDAFESAVYQAHSEKEI